METINHECYVSLEVAKLLKEAGFDWKCPCAYLSESLRGNKPFQWHYQPTNYNNKYYSDTTYSAPTLDLAQRWLRKVKGYIILVNYNEYLETFYYSICYTKNTNRYIDDRDDCRDTSFEEAQEVGIKKALEMILEKGGKNMDENYNKMVYGDQEFETFEEIFNYGLSLCKLNKKKKAQDFFTAYIYYLYNVNTRKDVPTIEYAEQCAKRNFGYFAGYYSDDVRKKVYNYFEAIHPVFGNRYNITAKEAFYAGVQRAEAEAREKESEK